MLSTQLPFAVDVRTVHGVSRPPVATIGRGIWSCTRCAQPFAVQDSHSVHFDCRGEPLAFVVCPSCAEKFDVPRPVVIDLDVAQRRADDTLDDAARATIAQARAAQAARGSTEPRQVSLRDVDVRRLADQHHTTPAQLAQRLDELGLMPTTTATRHSPTT